MLTGLLLGLLILIVLLAIPLTLDFNLGSRAPAENKFEVVWAFGLIRVKIPNGKGEQKADRKSAEIESSSQSGNAGKFPRKLISDRTARQRLVRCVRQLWASIEKQDIVIRIRAGLDDPADTGQLWAILGPISAALKSLRRFTINLEPDFMGKCFEFHGRGVIKFSPLRILSISLGLLLSPVIWKAVRES